MQKLAVPQDNPRDVRKAEMTGLCADGVITANPKELGNADFCGCIIENRSCAHANKIHKSLDPSATTLGCRKFRRQITIEEAMSCTDQT
ncbi:MAG: hypothetical protein NUV90_02590 [Candidatus Parcubacteria bacterium]|nr:hypothetical protein [Candidatus Parcubacteria bacterium]